MRPGSDDRHLPGDRSRAGTLPEELAEVAKQAVLLVDDVAPNGSRHDVEPLHRLAELTCVTRGTDRGGSGGTAEGDPAVGVRRASCRS